jgi:hypothetical protein
MNMAQSSDRIPIHTLLENLSRETARLAGVASELDELVGSLATTGGNIGPEQIVGLQSVDALRQALVAIAQITQTAATVLPAEANILLPRSKMASGVTIQAVSKACLGPDLVPSRCNDPAPANSVFFDEW